MYIIIVCNFYWLVRMYHNSTVIPELFEKNIDNDNFSDTYQSADWGPIVKKIRQIKEDEIFYLFSVLSFLMK